MDPTKQFLASSPRNLSQDAFFSSDRSSTAVTRQVGACDLPRVTGTCNNATQLDFGGWRNRFQILPFTAANPLPQTRKTAEGSAGVVDTSIQGWTHDVNYVTFASNSALSTPPPTQVRVVILFGTGSEAFRLGLCGVIDVASQPTILIIVPGIEPSYEIVFKNPGTGESKKLVANNRWGVGITENSIRAIVTQRLGAQTDYTIVVCACYSTGNQGLAGSIDRRLFSFQGLERAVVFDCLYNSLGPSLLSLKRAQPSMQVICYIATAGGNTFNTDPPTFSSLRWGNNSAYNYVNLFFNTNYYAAASARVIGEGVSPGNLIITALPPQFESTLNELTSHLPPRGTTVSDSTLFKKIKGTIPSNATTLNDFGATNSQQINRLFAQIATLRQCLRNAQLLGWPTPPGEEWHDLLLIEFAWEYLV